MTRESSRWCRDPSAVIRLRLLCIDSSRSCVSSVAAVRRDANVRRRSIPMTDRPVQSGSIELRRMTHATSRVLAAESRPKAHSSRADKDGIIGLPPGRYEVGRRPDRLDRRPGERSITLTVARFPRRYADYYTSSLRVQVTEGQMESIEVIVESEATKAGSNSG